ncbi:MAG: hypothetical protein NC240_03940 [Clostridium sp.]|nr:hypothetical protein [Clostridium sp.]
MKKTKEKTKGGYVAQSVASLIAAILIALLLFAAFSDDISYLFGKAESMNELLAEGEELKGEYVSVGVDAVVDWYAETTYKINGIIPAGSKWHCLVWLDDESFISLTVKGKKNKDLINNLISGTEKYLNGETNVLPSPVVFEGKIISIGSEVDEYFYDAIRYYGITGMEVHYLTIDTTYSKTSIILYGIIFLAIIGVFIGTFIGGIKGVKRLKAAEGLVASSPQGYNPQGFGENQTYNNAQTGSTYDNTQNTYGNMQDNTQTYNTYGNVQDNTQTYNAYGNAQDNTQAYNTYDNTQDNT